MKLFKSQPKEVIMPDSIYQEFMHYVFKSTFEVSCLGWCYFKDGTYTIEEMKLLEQENTGSDTEIDGASVAEYFFDIMGKKPDAWFHIHSHVNMGCTPSMTDNDTYRQLADEMPVVAAIFNKKNDFTMHFVQKIQIGKESDYLMMSGVKTSFPRFVDPEVIKKWDTNYDKQVDNKSWTGYTNNQTTYQLGFNNWIGGEWVKYHAGKYYNEQEWGERFNKVISLPPGKSTQNGKMTKSQKKKERKKMMGQLKKGFLRPIDGLTFAQYCAAFQVEKDKAPIGFNHVDYDDEGFWHDDVWYPYDNNFDFAFNGIT